MVERQGLILVQELVNFVDKFDSKVGRGFTRGDFARGDFARGDFTRGRFTLNLLAEHRILNFY
jgi:hypothetical protein